jgi:hypothetical protein
VRSRASARRIAGAKGRDSACSAGCSRSGTSFAESRAAGAAGPGHLRARADRRKRLGLIREGRCRVRRVVARLESDQNRHLRRHLGILRVGTRRPQPPTLRTPRIERAIPMTRPNARAVVGVRVWEAVKTVEPHRRLRRPTVPLGVSQSRPVTADVLGMERRQAGTTPLLIDVAQIPPRVRRDRPTATPTGHAAAPHDTGPSLAGRLVDGAVAMLPEPIAIATHRRLVRTFLNFGERYWRERDSVGRIHQKTGRCRPCSCRLRPRSVEPDQPRLIDTVRRQRRYASLLDAYLALCLALRVPLLD